MSALTTGVFIVRRRVDAVSKRRGCNPDVSWASQYKWNDWEAQQGCKGLGEVLTSLGHNGFADPINPKVRRAGVDKWQTSLIHAKTSNRRRTWF